MKKAFTFIMVWVLLFSCIGCSESTKNEVDLSITVSAAASLKDALKEIGPIFKKEKGIDVTFNFESSGTLKKQIEEGASVDVFLSAAEKQMDALDSKNLIDQESRKNFLKNSLVLIVGNEYKESIKSISDIIKMDVKMSIGTPESVPAGQYAKESMMHLNVWDKLDGKVVYAKNVKQVAMYVERGEVAAGIVYKSDATVLENSSVAEEFKDESHKPIVYPGAIVLGSEKKEYSKAFLDFVSSNEEALKIFKKYGFESYSK